jgi:hypothetical protein
MAIVYLLQGPLIGRDDGFIAQGARMELPEGDAGLARVTKTTMPAVRSILETSISGEEQ